MMKKLLKKLFVLSFLLVGAATFTHAAAPPLPIRVYGNITMDGNNLPSGIHVTAWIDGVQYAQSSTFLVNENSVYLIDIPGDDPETLEIEGGVEGNLIVFEVDGRTVIETAIWRSGTYLALDLVALPSPPDSDGDGMPDEYETTNGLNPTDPSDAVLDNDLDGLANLEEYRRGTDPNSIDSDGDNGSDQTEILCNSDPIDPASLNRPPQITSAPQTSGSEGNPYSYQVEAVDPDGDTLNFTLIQSSPGMSIDATGNIDWTPTSSQVGLNPVTVEVDDGRGCQDTQPFFVNVIPAGIDLTVDTVDASGVNTNSQTLVTFGNVIVDFSNQGGDPFSGTFDVIIFEDRNDNGLYDQLIDNSLGTATFSGDLPSGGSSTLEIPISGTILFEDNLLYAVIDVDGVADIQSSNDVAHSGESSLYVPPIGDFNPQVEWEWKADTALARIHSTPIVAPLIDTNGDGFVDNYDIPVVLIKVPVQSSGLDRLYALNGETGQPIFYIQETFGFDDIQSAPAVGDLDGDGVPEIVVGDGNLLKAYDNSGLQIWSTAAIPNNSGMPYLVDLDGDGSSEISFGYQMFNADGSERWRSQAWFVGGTTGQGYAGGNPYPGARDVADLDLDGLPEIIAGPSAYDKDGNLLWMWRTSRPSADFPHNIRGDLDLGATIIEFTSTVSLLDGWTAVANIDNDLNPEIILVSSAAQQEPNDGPEYSNDSIWIFEHDGQLFSDPIVVKRDIYAEITYRLGPPVVADFDNDGQVEIAVSAQRDMEAGFFTYEQPSLTSVLVYEIDGQLAWETELDVLNVRNTSFPISAFDFDGDGDEELLITASQNIYILSGLDGSILFSFPLDNDNASTNYATIADVDNDGNAEIIAPTHTFYLTGNQDGRGIVVLGDLGDNWLHSRGIWNQWQYKITNIEADSSVPPNADNNWEAFNNLRTQAPVDGLNPFAAPDLSVSDIQFNQSQCPSSAGISARIGNGGYLHTGSGIRVDFYAGDPAQGGILIGTAETTGAIYPGMFEEVSIEWSSPTSEEIFVTVNQPVVGPVISTDNLELLPYTSARTGGMSGSGTGIHTNQNAIRGIDGSLATAWVELSDTLNIDPNPAYFEVRFPYPVNASSINITNNNTNHGFLTGELTFSNGFSQSVDLGATAAGLITFPEQTDITWIRLTALTTRTSGAGLHEFSVAGSYIEHIVVLNEGSGRYDNNIASSGFAISPCDNSTNQPPQIISAPPLVAYVDNEYSYQMEGSDPNNDSLTYSLVNAPTGMSINPVNGLINWTPNVNQVGTETVTVQISDGNGGTAQQEFIVNVVIDSSVNQPPQITSEPGIKINLGQTFIYTLAAVDPDGDHIVFTLQQSPIGVDFNPLTGELTWFPNASDLGTQFFTVAAKDGFGGNDIQSFAIEVIYVNQMPVANAQSFVIEEDQQIPVTLTASDPDGDDLSYSVVSGPANGTLSGAAPNIVYTPNLEFSGNDNFTFTATDGISTSLAATITFDVIPINDPPIVNNQLITTIVDTPVEITLTGSDAEGDLLAFTVISDTVNGILSGTVPNLQYTPQPGYTGLDSFTFEATDGSSTSDTGIMVIRIDPINEGPILASVGDQSVDEGTVADVSISATDPNGDALSLTANGLPLFATIIDNGDGSGVLTIAPNFEDAGVYNISISASDGEITDTESINIIINNVNRAPVANTQNISTQEDESAAIVLTGSDPDGDSISYTIQTLPINGVLSGNAPDLTYTPNGNYFGIDSFNYYVNDGLADSSIATVTINILPVNDDPVANDDQAVTQENTPLNINVLSNDSDVDGDTLGITNVTNPTNGAVVINADNSLTYEPVLGFAGNDSFQYTISDGNGGIDTATVVVEVIAPNAVPVAVDDNATTSEDTSISVDVLANDNDPNGDILTLVDTSQPANGTVVINPDGSLTYTPEENFNSNDSGFGPDTFTYTISDGQGGSDSASVSVTVTAVNDAPELTDDVGNTLEDSSLIIDVLANDDDVEGDSLTVVSVTQPTNGSVTINPDNTVTYQPAFNYFGNDNFTYTVEDGNGGSATATVSITVQPVNDPPIASDDSASSPEDTPVTIDILVNDTDVENDALTVVSNSQPANGTVVLNADNTATYTPDENFNGSDSFTYTIQDGNGGTDSATVNVTINPVNDAPVAEDDSATLNEDTDVTIPVLANDIEFDGDTLSVTSTTSPANGEVVVNADNTITYTADSNFYGSDSFTYTVGDGTGLTDIGTVLITVSPVNDVPDAADDVATTDEDNDVVIDVLANDSDIEGDSLSITSLTTPAQGAATVNLDNTITYSPNANYYGTDSFSYSVVDSQGGTATAIVNVTIDPVNDSPEAADDSVSTPEDTAAVVNVLANDSDIDGDLLTVSAVTQPVNGAVIINADQTVTYTPAPSFNGTDIFTYTISDGSGGSASATVNVTVSAENDNPDAADDSEVTAEDTAVTIDVLANDDDIDGDSLTIASLTQPANGQATTNGADITYIPNANYFGSDAFTYTISDGNGGADTATVTVEVTSVNDAPDAVNDSATTAEDTAITISVLANDSDTEDDSLTITAVSSPANGNAISNGAEITYTPAANFNGTDSFTYTISDGNGGTDTAVVNLTITAVNDDPTTVDDNPVTPEDTAITFSPLANDSDVDGDPITIVSIGAASEGSAVLNPDQTVTYTPDANFAGSDSFSYTIEDDQGGSATANIVVVVLPINDVPIAANDSAALPEDGTAVIDVLANDSDVENDTLAVTSLTSPANGVAVINLDYTVTYTPTANFFGADSFSYTIDDGNGGTAAADVSIEVTSVNDAPVALNDSEATTEDTPVQIDVLSNDNDVDGDILTITGVTTPTQGTVAVNPDGTLTYTPDPDTYNADTFDYSIEDGNGGTATATVTIAVNPVNDAPVAEDDSVTTLEDTAVTIAVLSNDSDVDGNSLSVSSVPPPTLGTVVVNSDNSLTYTPYPNVNGSDNFTYTIIDGFGGMDTALVSVAISPVNDNPIAVDDSRVTLEDTAVTIDVLANDSDVDGDDLAVSSVTSPTNGTVVINLGNTLTYTPAPGYFGNDSFTYTIDDGNGGTAGATVTITVSAENDNPVAVDDTAFTDEDVEIIIDVLGNDTDEDNDVLSISNVTQPANGTTSINNGEIVYTPDVNFNGTDTFVYTVIDGAGGSDDATVVVTVYPVNDAPVAVEDSATTDAGTSVTIAVLANDSDVEADPLFIESISQATNGTVVANPDDTITYTPNPGFSGLDTFTYTVSDGDLTDTAVVAITVTPVAASCELYPIALHESSLAGVQIGDMVTDILNGDQPGNFGWLTWNGDNSVPALVASLTMPGNSHIYLNPHDPTDHVVSIGDWVKGKPGMSNSKKIRNALDALIGENIIVPIWNSSEGTGARPLYSISGFAEVQLVDYQLPGQDIISAIYLGSVACSDSP